MASFIKNGRNIFNLPFDEALKEVDVDFDPQKVLAEMIAYGCQKITPEPMVSASASESEEEKKQKAKTMVNYTKSFAEFIVKVAEKRPQLMFKNVHRITPFLEFNEVVMRSAVLTAYAEIVDGYLRFEAAQDLSDHMKNFAGKIREHMSCDVSSAVRGTALKLYFHRLFGRGHLHDKDELIEILVKRLQDKSASVQKIAIACLKSFTEKVQIRNINNISEKTSKNMKKLLDEGKFTDFTIRTGDGQELRVHRAILNASSAYFEAMFDLGGVEVQQSEMEVPETYETMIELVRFLYTGAFPSGIAVDEDAGKKLLEMYVAADKYQLTELLDFFEDAGEAFFSPNTICKTYVRAHFQGAEGLKKKAAEYIKNNKNEVINCEGWTELCRDYPGLVGCLFLTP